MAKTKLRRLQEWTSAVVRVGDGCGFIVEADGEPLVVTAAHCLPHPPPAANFLPSHELLYPSLLGPRGGEPTVTALCVFVDPVADLAVLVSPDSKEALEQAEAYSALVSPMVPLKIGTLPLIEAWEVEEKEASTAWLLALDGEWFRCKIFGLSRGMAITETERDIVPGMSGSPIISDDGHAIGVVTTSSVETTGTGGRAEMWEPQPMLSRHLPVWLVDEMSSI